MQAMRALEVEVCRGRSTGNRRRLSGSIVPWIPERPPRKRGGLRFSPREESGSSDPTPVDSRTGKRAASLQVLIVEDSLDAAQTLQELLQSIGYVVSVATSGPEGLQAALQLRPDVVLCDIGLPGLDGYQIAVRLKQVPASRAIRLIAVTGYGSAEDRRRAREAGFDHHLTKPVDLDELEALLAAEAALVEQISRGDEPAS